MIVTSLAALVGLNLETNIECFPETSLLAAAGSLVWHLTSVLQSIHHLLI